MDWRIYGPEKRARLYEVLKDMVEAATAEAKPTEIASIEDVVGEIVFYYAKTQAVAAKDGYAATKLKVLVDKNGAEILWGGS